MGNFENRRSGVAVIVVLGLLALLMVLGVAFSVTMRVERFGAGNYAYDVATKQVVWAGLARAIADLEKDIANDMYPDWDVLPSGTGGVTSLAFGEALDYVPGELQAVAATNNSEWIGLTNGACAYLIVNCSHMVDVNRDVKSREGGVSVDELQIDTFPSVASTNLFHKEHVDDVRYETLPELASLNTAVNGHDYFTTYSRYPLGILLNGGTAGAVTSSVPLVPLYGDENALAGRMDDIVAALNVAVPDSDAAAIYLNLLDYIDEDCVPRDLSSECTERVPMINEIRMWQVDLLRSSDVECQVAAQINIENAYPFVSSVSHTFSTEGSVAISLTPAVGPVQTSIVNFSELVDYDNDEPDPYYLVWTTPQATFAIDATASNFSFSVQLQGITNIVNEPSGPYQAGHPVDTVNVAAGSSDFTIEGAGTIPATGDMVVAPTNLVSWEAIDPRFNWIAGDDSMWLAPIDSTSLGAVDHTLGSENTWALDYFESRSGAGASGTPQYEKSGEMHVSDRGHLLAVGELGNLLRSKPGANSDWETIRLFDQESDNSVAERDEVLKYFTMSTDEVQRGLVNLNNPVDAPTLDAVFTNMPAMFNTDGPPIADADSVAIRNMITNWVDAGNAFYNVDDLAGLDWRGIPTFDTRSDLELESMLAYSAGLLGTRQNLFTIIVAEGAPAGGVGSRGSGETLIGRRAVAEVWRDPFPTVDQRHKCFVRFFKWMDD